MSEAVSQLRVSLEHQAEEGGWLNGFELRAIGDDPWQLGVEDPGVTYFEKPPEQAKHVDELRGMIYGVARAAFIDDSSWSRTCEQIERLYTDPRVQEFRHEREGNLIMVTPHRQFHDLGILAAASLEVRAGLPKDNPFYDVEDPASGHMIVANRVLALLEQPLFKEATGLPVLEGLMLPIADVMTTISANGSGRLARRKLGRNAVRAMNATTREHIMERTTRGGHIIFEATSGNVAKPAPVDAYSEALIVGKPSKGTAEVITVLNRGEPATRKNAVVAAFIDCPSIQPNGQIASQHAGVAVHPEVWTPRNERELRLVMRAMIRAGVGQSPAEFRMHPRRDPKLTNRDQRRLDKIAVGS